MARRSQARALDVWINGLRVGRWSIPTRGPMELTYDPGWVEGPAARPLSLSLPLSFDGLPLRGERVGSYFDNLLPDSEAIRQRIRSRFHTRTQEAFDLLAAVGRDCVGAVQLLPEGEAPEGVTEIAVTPLADQDVEALLRGATATPLAADEDESFRISIAGAQEKTALTWHDGRWCRPHGATPTTHIFKLPLGLVGGRQMDLRDSLENEWLCAKLLAAFGVPVAECEVQRFGSMKALVVRRFDRTLHSSARYWLRLPQEDCCQATGTPSSSKYEADGGPGLVNLASLLQGSVSRSEDLATLLRAQLLFFLLAATDGHAKNFSLHLLAGSRYRLAPLYDVLSAWPVAGPRANQIHPKKLKLAMALHGASKHYRLDEIRRRHFAETARRCQVSTMDAILEEVVARTPGAIDAVAGQLPAGFPARVFAAITENLRRAGRELLEQPPD